MSSLLDTQTLIPGIMEAIRSQILKGTLPAGSRLRQADIATALRVSPVPLREALRGLEAEGLVTFLPFKGAIVTPVTVEEIEEIQDLSMALELALAPMAFPRLTPDDFKLLYALCDELDQGNRSPETVIEFYRILFQPACRPQMLRIIENMVWRTVRFFPLMQGVRSGLRNVEPTRQRLIQAIEAGDIDVSKQVLLEYHQVRVNALVASLREQGATSEDAQ
ncbi:MAG: GntR family transcriptional regulator [Acidobacteria bacterium]|nr:GntR family transcriptional regulator [Acidobacteriota bacterium]